MKTGMASHRLAIGLLVFGVAGLSLVGCGVVVPPGGEGALSGTVTNSATDEGIAGATVTLDPAVSGVEITTDNTGAYSADNIPAGVYTLTFEADGFNPAERTVSIGTAATVVDVALDPAESVRIATSMEGTAEPGGTVTAKVTVTVLDGETQVQGISWTQSNSVEVILSGANTNTVTVTLPDRATYRAELITDLMEPPISATQLPPNIPVPPEPFPGGLPDRFQVVGINPFALEEAGAVTLQVSVETTAGTFEDEVEISTSLPWDFTSGIDNVPIGVPVVLHGKTQDTYDWALSTPAGSSASLVDPTTQNPEFTPDVAGLYRITVTDNTGDTPADVTMDIYAGTWVGAITGQDAEGFPVAAGCMACHNGNIAPDVFTPWSKTGHAMIFSDNLDTSDHYSTSCFECHTVGYNPSVDNGGIDDASDYDAFLAEFSPDGVSIHSAPGNWAMMLANEPDSAQLANIQCENCHGPNSSQAHTMGTPRVSLRSDVCGFCHGEPARHGRFQQWQLSGHANYEVAESEGTRGSCARCHAANGYLEYLPLLLAGENPSEVEVTWTADEIQPITCAVCHDPHDIGTTSGNASNAKVRVMDNTPALPSGFTALGVGRGAICITCHNSRNGAHNDQTFDEVVAAGNSGQAPHRSAQSDVLLGENAYFVETGIRSAHSLVEDTCVNCHMIKTPPPDLLSYQLGGTNHTFFAASTVCSECHGEFESIEPVEAAFDANIDELRPLIETAIINAIDEQLDAGHTVNLGDAATLTTSGQIDGAELSEVHGQAGVILTVNGTELEGLAMRDVTVDLGGAEPERLYDVADPRLVKATWNYFLAENDGSDGVHNPGFVFGFLNASIDALNQLAAE